MQSYARIPIKANECILRKGGLSTRISGHSTVLVNKHTRMIVQVLRPQNALNHSLDLFRRTIDVERRADRPVALQHQLGDDQRDIGQHADNSGPRQSLPVLKEHGAPVHGARPA